ERSSRLDDMDPPHHVNSLTGSVEIPESCVLPEGVSMDCSCPCPLRAVADASLAYHTGHHPCCLSPFGEPPPNQSPGTRVDHFYLRVFVYVCAFDANRPGP